jgi:hypothetical protein
MKRDMDLVRKILLDYEKSGEFDTSDPVEAGHVAIMKDAGLVEAGVAENESGAPIAATIVRITWAGHDFIDNARTPEVWKKVKDVFPGQAVSASFEIVGMLLKAANAATLGLPL